MQWFQGFQTPELGHGTRANDARTISGHCTGDACTIRTDDTSSIALMAARFRQISMIWEPFDTFVSPGGALVDLWGAIFRPRISDGRSGQT